MSGDGICWFNCYWGRDWVRGPGNWVFSAAFIMRPDLMTPPSDWGRMVLSALRIEINVRIPGVRSWPWPTWRRYSGPLIRVQITSDADDIATRLAEAR